MLASHVRALAGQVRPRTHEISGLVAALRNESAAVGAAVAAGAESVGRGVERSLEAAKSLGEIAEAAMQAAAERFSVQNLRSSEPRPSRRGTAHRLLLCTSRPPAKKFDGPSTVRS